MSNEPNAQFLGHHVVDTHDEQVGTITDVIYDQEAGKPTWLVVDPGIMRASRYVPVDRSYRAEDGSVVVPFEKRAITTAPKATGNHILTGEVESDLIDHYGVSR
jgi:sporulation protein YlmC with PRC-barrel domain